MGEMVAQGERIFLAKVTGFNKETGMSIKPSLLKTKAEYDKWRESLSDPYVAEDGKGFEIISTPYFVYSVQMRDIFIDDLFTYEKGSK